MINLRIVRQTFDFDCGAKALQAVMEYYGVEIREDILIQALGSGEHGTNYQNMITVAEENGFQVFASYNVSLEKLKECVHQGHPVIVLVQAWADKYMTLEDWRQDYEDGHYAVVIDYLDNIIVFEDPSSTRRTWLTHEEFLARWHDKDPASGENLDHFAMILTGREPAANTPEHMD